MIVDLIREGWGWTGVEPIEVVATNAFGNVIFRDSADRYWRLCPEDSYCRVIAESGADYERLLGDQEFLLDWEMEQLVQAAYRKVGPLKPEWCYCLRIPAVLGGEYGADNLGTVPIRQAILFSGDLASKLEEVPDGTTVVLKVVD